MVNGKHFPIAYIDTTQIPIENDQYMKLLNALRVPAIKKSLVSISKLLKTMYTLNFIQMLVL